MLEQLMLDPRTHIYLELVSSVERHEHLYVATPSSVFRKEPKRILLLEKRMELETKTWHAGTT